MTGPAMTYPGWLPDPVAFQGDWDSFVRALYAVFEADFKYGRPRYQNCPVWHDRRVEAGDTYGYEEGFWHLVTRDQWVWNSTVRRKEKQRLPELDRASRMPWTKPTIDHDTEPEMLVWDFEDETRRGKAVRSYIWIKEFDFAVILERQTKRFGDVYLLITSFYIDHEGKRRDLQGRYDRRIK